VLKLFLISLAVLGIASPLGAQGRSASIGVAATVAEPVRTPDAPAVTVDLREGRYLDVSAAAAKAASPTYLVDVTVSPVPREGDRDQARGAAGGETGRIAAGRGGSYRLDLARGDPRGSPVLVTYVVAANL
jgi:hypothetical protein